MKKKMKECKEDTMQINWCLGVSRSVVDLKVQNLCWWYEERRYNADQLMPLGEQECGRFEISEWV